MSAELGGLHAPASRPWSVSSTRPPPRHVTKGGDRAISRDCSFTPYRLALKWIAVLRTRKSHFGNEQHLNIHLLLSPRLPVQLPSSSSSTSRTRTEAALTALTCIRHVSLRLKFSAPKASHVATSHFQGGGKVLLTSATPANGCIELTKKKRIYPEMQKRKHSHVFQEMIPFPILQMRKTSIS